jgi:hypothetical protein
MFKGHPKGLYALALANTGERFGYYTMLAIFVLFLQAKFGFTAAQAGQFSLGGIGIQYAASESVFADELLFRPLLCNLENLFL